MAGRARAEAAAKNNAQLLDKSWQIWKKCEYCDRDVCVNNYDDRKPRTPKFMGLVICPWCDPRHPDDKWLWRDGPKGDKPRVYKPFQWRTCMSVYILRALMTEGRKPDGSTAKLHKLLENAEKYWDPEGKPKTIATRNTDPTQMTDAQIYGEHRYRPA